MPPKKTPLRRSKRAASKKDQLRRSKRPASREASKRIRQIFERYARNAILFEILQFSILANGEPIYDPRISAIEVKKAVAEIAESEAEDKKKPARSRKSKVKKSNVTTKGVKHNKASTKNKTAPKIQVPGKPKRVEDDAASEHSVVIIGEKKGVENRAFGTDIVKTEKQ